MDIQLHVRMAGGAAVLDAAGELDIYTSPKLKAAIQDLLDGGQVYLLINLLNTTYLDSTALSVLSVALKQARDAGGNLGLIYMQPRVEKIFTITGLNEVFPTFRSEAEALEAARAWLKESPRA